MVVEEGSSKSLSRLDNATEIITSQRWLRVHQSKTVSSLARNSNDMNVSNLGEFSDTTEAYPLLSYTKGVITHRNFLNCTMEDITSGFEKWRSRRYS